MIPHHVGPEHLDSSIGELPTRGRKREHGERGQQDTGAPGDRRSDESPMKQGARGKAEPGDERRQTPEARG